jgi:hypothetical protein
MWWEGLKRRLLLSKGHERHSINLLGCRNLPPVIAEFLAILPFRAVTVNFPGLAQLASGTGIAWAFTFMVHERRLQ